MSIKKWKTLSSEYVSRRPWLTARRDRVQLPNGQIHDEYYVLEYPTWVNIIAIRPDGKFVMIEQYRHGLGTVETELCAGCADEGEEPIDAARRELAEETGYTGRKWRLNTVLCANPATSNNLSYCFIAEGVEHTGDQHLDRTEDIAIHVYTREEVFDMLRADKFKQALMAASLWKYFFENR